MKIWIMVYFWLCSASVFAQVKELDIPLSDDKELLYRDVADQLRCPTCTGLSVLGSDADFSIQIRNIVREQVAAGKPRDEVLKFFEERYGAWILRSPPEKGFGFLAWFIPISMLVLGPILVWALAWRKRKVVKTFGVRPVDAIIGQMESELLSLRGAKSR